MPYFKKKLKKGKTENAQTMLSLTINAWSEGVGCNYPNMRGFSIITPNLRGFWVIYPNFYMVIMILNVS